jgi:hypothetical protein
MSGAVSGIGRVATFRERRPAMAERPRQRHSSYIWLWIVVGIIIVIALIWWLGAANTVPPPQPAETSGVNTLDNVEPDTTDTATQPNTAGQGEPAAPEAASTTSAPPAMSDATTSPAT